MDGDDELTGRRQREKIRLGQHAIGGTRSCGRVECLTTAGQTHFAKFDSSMTARRDAQANAYSQRIVGRGPIATTPCYMSKPPAG